MKIEPKQIKVREVFESYADNGDDGVFAYGGRLAIRPPYQREFVYDAEQAEAVYVQKNRCLQVSEIR